MGSLGRAKVAFRRYTLDHRLDGRHQFGQSLARLGRDRQDLRALQDSAFQRVFDVGGYQLQPVVVDKVLLGKGDQAARDAEKIEYREVLACLWHYRFVGGDHQQREIDPADSGEHVVDESLVSGHVDDADLAAGRQFKPREAEVYRQPALLLLGEPVGVDSGERLDERRLPVVDMPCCSCDEHRLCLPSPEFGVA